MAKNLVISVKIKLDLISNIGELCFYLKAESLSILNRFVPPVLTIFQKCISIFAYCSKGLP